VRAANPGGAVLRVRVAIGSGFVVLRDLTFDRTGNAVAGVAITGGFPHLRGPRWQGAYASPGLDVSGPSSVVLFPGVAGYADETQASTAPLFTIRGTALVEIAGGVFDGAGFGSSAGAITVDEEGVLVLSDVTLRPVGRGIALSGDATLEMNGGTLEPREMTGADYGVRFGAGFESRATFSNTTISGFSAALLVTGPAGIVFFGTTLSDGARGIVVDDSGAAAVQAFGLTVDGNAGGGIVAEGFLSLNVDEGAFSGNGVAAVRLAGGFAHEMHLRRVAISGNDTGLVLAGIPGAVFDLGTAGSPGENIITGNATTGLDVQVDPDPELLVSASGNTFIAGEQGADAGGHYQLGAGPCGVTSCVVTSGDGLNYRVAPGSHLRLAP
jgi:hypothetical protein